MIKNIIREALILLIFFFFFLTPCKAHTQGWSELIIRTLPDSSFALIEVDKNGKKVKHFPYKDANGAVDINQLIYCLGAFSYEIWIDSKKQEVAMKTLEEHYYKFKLKQTKEGIKDPININHARLKDLVRLPNIGPVTAVKIYQYREIHGLFKKVEDIKKVEGIGPAIFTGIRYYIKVW